MTFCHLGCCENFLYWYYEIIVAENAGDGEIYTGSINNGILRML